MKVVVRSSVQPPAPLYIAAGQMPSRPGCVGTIELYRMSDGWRADVVHEPDCSWLLLPESNRPTAAARLRPQPAHG